MKKIISFLNNFFARLSVIFTFCLAVASALGEYGIINTTYFTPKNFMIIGITAFALSVVIAFLLKKLQIPNKNLNYSTNKKHKDNNDPENEIVDKMYNRIGSSRSLIKYSDMNDTKHKYSQMGRYDILDYNNDNYQSIRIFHGINSSNSISTFLPYCESTEYKIDFNAIVIEAYDLLTGRKLKVECANDSPTEKLCTHRFRINFERPLQPGESFHVLYYLSFPHELNCLSQEREIMSISLIRIKKKPIKNLSFNVLLNYEPSLVRFFSYDDNSKKSKILHSNETVKLTDLRDSLNGIDKNVLKKIPVNMDQKFYMAGINLEKAKHSMYIIEYQN